MFHLDELTIVSEVVVEARNEMDSRFPSDALNACKFFDLEEQTIASP